jgi:hypothetical protein
VRSSWGADWGEGSDPKDWGEGSEALGCATTQSVASASKLDVMFMFMFIFMSMFTFMSMFM